MASGIIIHITVGSEKRTEFFTEERVSIGSDDTNDLQIHTNGVNGSGGVWLELDNSDGFYRIIEFDPALTKPSMVCLSRRLSSSIGKLRWCGLMPGSSTRSCA